METMVTEDSPLADYLEGIDGTIYQQSSDSDSVSSSPSPSFAPRGFPAVPSRYRNRVAPALRVTVPSEKAVTVIHNTCSKALTASLGRIDNSKFLEQFRYAIIASQLLSNTSHYGYLGARIAPDPATPVDVTSSRPITAGGAGFSTACAFILACLLHWCRGASSLTQFAGRLALLLGLCAVLSTTSYMYIRRQWLQHLRQQTLAHNSTLLESARNLDAVSTAALTLIQEVELVSKGYKISSPLPPISRLEDRTHAKRCTQLRKSLQEALIKLIPRYKLAYDVLRPMAASQDFERYLDVYDISELDIQEINLTMNEEDSEDPCSLRMLRIFVSRLYTTRRLVLCCLLAVGADGGKTDFGRWSTVNAEIRALGSFSEEAASYLQDVLGEQESFPVPPTPKLPQTPGRERWRVQLRKLSTLSSGIRGLQAKMHLLREESDKALDESGDLTDLGPSLMYQYESIGVDLRALMQEWEAGRTALANNIDRNEKRLSSMSTLSTMSGMLSPTSSLGGLTSVEEGSPTDALKALSGDDSRSKSLDLSSSDMEEVFEAIAVPRQRSTLSREERLAKMKEERVRREHVRDKADANTHMLRELESVINLRPRRKTNPAPRITTL